MNQPPIEQWVAKYIAQKVAEFATMNGIPPWQVDAEIACAQGPLTGDCKVYVTLRVKPDVVPPPKYGSAEWECCTCGYNPCLCNQQ